MAFRYNATTLSLLESIMKENRYIVRYEKGSFQSGYCILQDKRVAVINKFYDTESRINALIEIMHQVELSTEGLDEKQLEIFNKVSQQKLELE
ncbi:MAG: hypothetical protein IT274_07775 [Chitinophagales bacterium]|nr:hypothetical protein [Chitinophagales bacterium]